ncbi:hypothetical protein ATK17_3844 [Branchiibius hedensis]|uniref:Uncharacterized protein n=1 Tax=Branchiibius hedensis TaxID=672460 RepID=A0A2Y9BLL1_9MICO|nr:hypothetical protein [Branchiibius hedensis]PWJ23350.1 hypothetical protein ATK17_3844 [Branchiibius hedensis]SSA59039.1 hypothetical protein SAMN04489750_3844 [Branchiibius hedensis]
MSTSSTPVDGRSIGELLLDADFQSRQLLLDVDGDDAAAMLRTWGEVVQAAGELWSALPPHRLSSPVDGATMQRLEAMSQAQHRVQLAQGWPGDGPPDERLLSIAGNLQRAAELAAGPGRHVRPRTEAGRKDLDSARMRVMHTLYVGAHAVGVAVHQHVDDVRARSTKRASARELRGIPRGQDAATRITAFEQLAGGYVGNGFSRVLAGEHYTPPWGTGRLHQAFVAWDIQAHRTLAAAPSAANLNLVAGTQAMIATASTALLGAAAAAGRVDGDDYQHRLAPALDANQQSWARGANRWGTLSSRGERADPALVHAAGECRAAVHEIAFDRTRWATPDVMASRVDLADAAVTVQQAMIATAELACVYRDVVDQEPELQGSARIMAAWTREVDQTDPNRASTHDFSAPVSPADVHANRAVKIPDIVRQSLVSDADEVVEVSRAAMSATGALTNVARPPVDETQGCARCRPEEKDRVATPAPGRQPAPTL